MKRCLLALLFVGALLLPSGPVLAATRLVTDEITTKSLYSWPNSSDPNAPPGTTAVVDTVLHEIRLPQRIAGPGILDGRPGEGYDLVVINGNAVESYAFDGNQMVRNDVLSIPDLTRPLSVAGRYASRDVVVVNDTDVTHYSFNSQGLIDNPFLSVFGLTAPVQVEVRENQGNLFVLQDTEVLAYSYDGVQMVSNPAFSIGGLSNPLAMALHPNTYDVVVLEEGEARYFSWNGASFKQNPALSVVGITDAVAVEVASDGTVYVATQREILAYGFDGQTMRSNTLLSVPDAAGIAAFTIVGDGHSLAVHFGDEIRFYQFDGSQMVENPYLRIVGLQGNGAAGDYVSTATAVSAVFPVAEPVDALVVRANVEIPDDTAIQFFTSNDGGRTWEAQKNGRGAAFDHPQTTGALWRAVLTTSDGQKTPKVLPNIELDQVYRPDQPNPISVGPRNSDGFVPTITPEVTWVFSDRDEEDYQTAFQIIVYDRDSGDVVYNSGKISTLLDPDPPKDEPGPTPLTVNDIRGGQQSFVLPPGALSKGWRFRVKVRVWDMYDIPSKWSEVGPGSGPGGPATNPDGTGPLQDPDPDDPTIPPWEDPGEGSDFDVMAFYNFTVTSMVRPPASAPPLPSSDLPIPVRAGALFTYTVDSIGPIATAAATWFDQTPNPTTALTLLARSAPDRAKWAGEYFTLATLPNGTLVSTLLTGFNDPGTLMGWTSMQPIYIDGSIYDVFTVYLNEGNPGDGHKRPAYDR